jgi:hypothetical protein
VTKSAAAEVERAFARLDRQIKASHPRVKRVSIEAEALGRHLARREPIPSA